MGKYDKREAVMRAAMELVGEYGFHGSPMAAIAGRAGVAAGTIYRYFDSKDVLIRETHRCLEGQILAVLMTGYPESEPVRERFLHIWQRLVCYFISSPLEFRFIEQFYNSPFGVACRRDKILGKKEKDPITGLFEEGQEQQLIKDLPMPALCALTYGPLVNICRDHILQFIELDGALVTRTAEACWDAVRR